MLGTLGKGRWLMSRILVVDDEPDLRHILRVFLERAGHQVLDAGNGAEALAAAQLSAPVLVVTDMTMPVMGGAELVRRLRADPATAHIPILAATSDIRLAAAADAVLSKPYSRARLLSAVDALLEQGARTH
jgi:CheY-like chemotaxis protein